MAQPASSLKKLIIEMSKKRYIQRTRMPSRVKYCRKGTKIVLGDKDQEMIHQDPENYERLP